MKLQFLRVAHLGQGMASPKRSAPYQYPWNFKNSKSSLRAFCMSGPMRGKGPPAAKQKKKCKGPVTEIV